MSSPMEKKADETPVKKLSESMDDLDEYMEDSPDRFFPTMKELHIKH